MLEVPHLVTASGPVNQLDALFLSEKVRIESWFRQAWQETPPVFYGSVDLRNAGFKMAPVDTNLFPAGFNNLNPDMMALCVQAVQSTMAEKCPSATRLLLIPESHTRNIMYFENLAMLTDILMRAGFDVRIGSMTEGLDKPIHHVLPSSREITLEPLIEENGKVGVSNYFPCCIILNNDLSAGVPKIFQQSTQRFMPIKELGWSTRLKSTHFAFYQSVCESFAKLLNIDPWLIMPLFDYCHDVSFEDIQEHALLVDRANDLFKKIQAKYNEYKITQKPFLVVKADQGTYGMAVMMIQSPDELLHLNRKQRSKMSTSKGGNDVTKVIIQEGVFSFETVGLDESVAEPVVYHIGRHVVGGFYRVHSNRGPNENLNAPGMNFVPLAFAKNCHVPPGQVCNASEEANRFYTYGVISRLAMMAAARESHAAAQ